VPAHLIGHQEFRILGPAIEPLGEADLLFPQGLAVGGRRILAVGRAITDMGADDDQGRAILFPARLFEGRGQCLQIIGPVSHVPYVPAIGLEAQGRIVGAGKGRASLDGNAVIVKDADQFSQA